jgi:hypothetical protein
MISFDNIKKQMIFNIHASTDTDKLLIQPLNYVIESKGDDTYSSDSFTLCEKYALHKFSSLTRVNSLQIFVGMPTQLPPEEYFVVSSFDINNNVLKFNESITLSLYKTELIETGWIRSIKSKVPTLIKTIIIKAVQVLVDKICIKMPTEDSAQETKECDGEYLTKTVFDNRTEWRNSRNELHRPEKEGPALIYTDGHNEWCLNGKLHRTDGPAVESLAGHKEWCLNGKLHRTDGPAIECSNGVKYWCLNGKLHRTDGPALESPNGVRLWYLNGINLTKQEVLEQSALSDEKDQEDCGLDDTEREAFFKSVTVTDTPLTDSPPTTDEKDQEDCGLDDAEREAFFKSVTVTDTPLTDTPLTDTPPTTEIYNKEIKRKIIAFVKQKLCEVEMAREREDKKKLSIEIFEKLAEPAGKIFVSEHSKFKYVVMAKMIEFYNKENFVEMKDFYFRIFDSEIPHF